MWDRLSKIVQNVNLDALKLITYTHYSSVEVKREQTSID